MPQTKEEKAQYKKEWYQKNKDKIKQQEKEYYEKNKDKRKEYQKEYNLINKNKISQYHKEYLQTPQGIKSNRICHCKSYGLVCEDVDVLYQHYLDTTHCDNCDVVLTYDKRNTSTTKCMDHCHVTGEFRNILCHSCNIIRR